MVENQYGKISKLRMIADKKEDKTILEDVYFTMPFKVVKPFYEEDCDRMKVMMISLSAGLMAGDTQNVEIILKEGSRMEALSQSYEKIHKMEDGFARRKTRITQGKNTVLYYSPLPTIPFADSEFFSDTKIRLEEESSTLVYEEILSCGRAGCGERFQYRGYYNRLEICCKGHMKYLDNTRYTPDEMDMEGFGMYEGHTHLLNLILCNYDLEGHKSLQEIKNFLAENDICGGATKLDDNWYCIKLLGDSAQELIKWKEEILG